MTESNQPPRTIILPRPECEAFLWIVAGSRAGETVPCSGDGIVIGVDDQCDLRFDIVEFPHLQGVRIAVRRDVHSWAVQQIDGLGLLVNQQLVGEVATLRSGDIIRLSWRGPDLQFVTQSDAARSISEIVDTVSPPTGVDPAHSVKSDSNDVPDVQPAERNNHFFDYRHWTATQKSCAMGLVAAVVAAILLFLVSPGVSPADNETSESRQANDEN